MRYKNTNMVFPIWCEFGYYDEVSVIDEDILQDPKYVDKIDADVLAKNASAIDDDGRYQSVFNKCVLKESLLVSIIIILIIIMVWKTKVDRFVGSFVDKYGLCFTAGLVLVSIVGVVGIGYDMLNLWFYRKNFRANFNAVYRGMLNTAVNNTNEGTRLSPLQIYSNAYNKAVAETRFEALSISGFTGDIHSTLAMAFGAVAASAIMDVMIVGSGTTEAFFDKSKKYFLGA